MDNVWGKGGLFEQALANKMDRQASEAALNRSNVGVNMMNAQTNRLEADNKYDLGLRADKIAQGNLGVSQQNARTGVFNADTQRLIGFNQSGKAAPDSALINSLGLRTVNPYSPSSTPAAPSATSTPSPSPVFSTSTGSSVKPNSFGDKPFGMRNGGMVMKPKMVKQPGYKHGGKITMPKGYKAGGKIGDVAKDDGADKVDVVAREGEYFLNPETVAHIGGGDYSKGVRSLDNLVRQATGKEPGPVPVGKGGKPGYADSGSVNPNEEFFRRAALDKMAEAKAAARAPAQGGPTVFVDAQGNASTAAPRSTFAAVGEAPVGESLRKGATQAVNAVKNVLPSVETAAKGVRGFGKVATPVAAVADAADVVDVATDPNMSGRDVAGEVAGKVGKWGAATAAGLKAGALGAAASGPFAPVVAPLAALAGGATGYFLADKAIEAGRALRGVDTRDPSEYSQGVFSGKPAAAAPAEKPAAAPAAAPRDFDKEVRDKLAESEAKKPSLRDMMLARYRELNDGLKGADAMKTITSLNQMAGLQGDLTKLEEQEMQTAGARGAAQLKAAQQMREDADKRIAERYQIPKFDKEGRVVGYEKNPNAANEIRDFAAQMFTGADGRPVDLYALSPEMQDKVFHAYDINSRGMRRMNERFANEGGAKARTSMVPRVGANAVRSAGEISFGDILDPNISFGDWATSWGPNKMEKLKLYDPVTDQYFAARHKLMREDGTIDQDLVDQMNRAAAANQKK